MHNIRFIRSLFKQWMIIPATLLVVFIMLFLNTKVHPQGLSYYEVSRDRHVGGPFESSGSTSRFALTESIVRDKTFIFDTKLGSFAAPDVAGEKGRYFTIFAPGVSMLAIPFYQLGSQFGFQQFTAYLVNIFFATAAAWMIILILKRYGYPRYLQIASALIFIFATNAFTYSLYFTQHIISAFLILLSIYLTTFKPRVLTNTLLGVLFGVGLLVDIPNAFMLFPAIFIQLLRHFEITDLKEKTKLQIKTVLIFMALGLIPVLGIFGWYNQQVTGSPTLLPQFIGRISHFDEEVIPEEKKIAQDTVAEEKKGEFKFGEDSPFLTRLQLNGMYILLISDERGWLYYSPVLFIGVIGIYLLYKKKEGNEIVTIPLSIVLVNILLYSMFGDHWGGWSFGARYLIPGAAIMTLFIPEVLTHFKKNIGVLVFVSVLIIYSVFVNALGAITTTEVPPKQEAERLPTYIPYTYQYNYLLVEKNESYSLLNTYILKDVPGKAIWIAESTIISLLILLPILIVPVKELLVISRKKQ